MLAALRWPFCLGVLLLVGGPSARADHSFPVPEDFDQAGNELPSVEITEEITLLGAADRFGRDPVGPPLAFSTDTLLPVSDDQPGADLAEEKELVWSKGPLGDDVSLALTPDDVPGNYPSVGVHVEAILAAAGDLDSTAQPGVVARYQDQVGFYIASAFIGTGEAGYAVFLQVGKIAVVSPIAIVPLDEYLTPVLNGPFRYDEGENLRLRLEVGEPDDTGESHICGFLERLYVRDGVQYRRRLATIAGRDSTLASGRAGVYASSGTTDAAIQIGFDLVNLTVTDLFSVACLVPRLGAHFAQLKTLPADGEMTGLDEDVNLRWKTKLVRRVERVTRALDRDRLPKAARSLQKIRLRTDASPELLDWLTGQAAAESVALIDAMLGQLPST